MERDESAIKFFYKSTMRSSYLGFHVFYKMIKRSMLFLFRSRSSAKLFFFDWSLLILLCGFFLLLSVKNYVLSIELITFWVPKQSLSKLSGLRIILDL